jgi:hypothetical protein
MDNGSWKSTVRCLSCGKVLITTEDVCDENDLRVWCEKCATGASSIEIHQPIIYGYPGWECTKCHIEWEGGMSDHVCGAQFAVFKRVYRVGSFRIIKS